MHLYANFAASTRSDLMRLAKPLTLRDRFDMFVFFKDGATDPAAFNGRIPYTHVTSRPADIYFDCNHVRVEYRIDKKQGRIAFALFTDGTMFNFDGFAISRDNGKTWERSGADFFIPIPKESGSFRVAAVNMAGRFGRPTTVTISAH